MRRIFAVTLLLAGGAGLLAGCKEDAPTAGSGSGAPAGGSDGAAAGGGSRGPSTSSSPMQASAYQVLQEVAEALDAKDYDRAVTYFHVPPGASAEQFKQKAPEMLAMQAVSKEGVDILGSHGKWGKLAEVIPEARAKELADRFKVPLDECYGLKHGEGEAGFHWTGDDFKVIHCINVGKLKK